MKTTPWILGVFVIGLGCNPGKQDGSDDGESGDGSSTQGGSDTGGPPTGDVPDGDSSGGSDESGSTVGNGVSGVDSCAVGLRERGDLRDPGMTRARAAKAPRSVP